MPNAAAGPECLVGAGRLAAYWAGGSLLGIPDRQKLVCIYLGLIQGHSLGGERTVCVQFG